MLNNPTLKYYYSLKCFILNRDFFNKIYSIIIKVQCLNHKAMRHLACVKSNTIFEEYPDPEDFPGSEEEPERKDWTKEEMDKAKPMPMPEVPSEENAPTEDAS